MVTLSLCVMRRYNLGEGDLVQYPQLLYHKRYQVNHKYSFWEPGTYKKCIFVFAHIVGRSPRQVLSCVVGVWTTHRGGWVPRVFTERSEGPVVTLNFVSHDSEAVHSRGRGPGIHIKIQ